MGRLRCCRGQATVEYAALVALVAIALAGAVGLTAGGLGGHVLAALQRALCRVMPIGCPAPIVPGPDLAACTVERDERGERVSATVAVVRLGAGGTLTVNRLSDGRATVTLARGSGAGGQVGLGARMRLGRRQVGGELTATVGYEWTAGRTWRFANEAAARRFVATYGGKATVKGQLLDGLRSRCSLLCDAIGWRPHPKLPAPDETFTESGPTAGLAAAFGVARATLRNARTIGRRLGRDGTRVWYLRAGLAVGGALELPGAELVAGGERETVIAYEVDGAGTPRTLRILRAGGLRGRASGKPRHRGARGVEGRELGALVELEVTLDLREPAARDAARRLLEALTDGGVAALAAAAGALSGRIERDAQIDRRVYGRAGSATGAGLGVGLGAKLDGEVERSTGGLRLIAAETRLPGLPFLPRDDCRPG